MTTFEQVRNMLIAEIPGIETMTEKSRLRDDLGFDSLDEANVIITIEDRFGVQITDAEADKMVTVGDIVKFLEGKGV